MEFGVRSRVREASQSSPARRFKPFPVQRTNERDRFRSQTSSPNYRPRSPRSLLPAQSSKSKSDDAELHYLYLYLYIRREKRNEPVRHEVKGGLRLPVQYLVSKVILEGIWFCPQNAMETLVSKRRGLGKQLQLRCTAQRIGITLPTQQSHN